MRIDAITKRFEGKAVFENFSLVIAGGGITTLFGSNGTGKTTLLGICAGLISIDSGKVEQNIPPEAISVMFQNYRDSLMPWLTARGNILLPLEIQRYGTEDREERLREMISRLAVHIDLDKYPYELSGGQQQMVAFMRAIITWPRLLLIDEPFSSLDEEKNRLISQAIHGYAKNYSSTVLCVTHDLDHARSLSDEVVILEGSPARVKKVLRKT